MFRIHKLVCTLHLVSRVCLFQCICTIIPGGENLQFVLLTHKASPDLQIICIIIPPVSKPCTKLCTVTICVMKYAIRIIKHLKPSGNYMYHLLYNIYNSSFFTHNVFDCPLLFKQTVTSCKTTTLTSCKTTTVTSCKTTTVTSCKTTTLTSCKTTTVTSCKTTRVTSCKTTRVTSCKTTTVTFALCSGY